MDKFLGILVFLVASLAWGMLAYIDKMVVVQFLTFWIPVYLGVQMYEWSHRRLYDQSIRRDIFHELD